MDAQTHDVFSARSPRFPRDRIHTSQHRERFPRLARDASLTLPTQPLPPSRRTPGLSKAMLPLLSVTACASESAVLTGGGRYSDRSSTSSSWLERRLQLQSSASYPLHRATWETASGGNNFWWWSSHVQRGLTGSKIQICLAQKLELGAVHGWCWMKPGLMMNGIALVHHVLIVDCPFEPNDSSSFPRVF